jgi:hypothetical protein
MIWRRVETIKSRDAKPKLKVETSSIIVVATNYCSRISGAAAHEHPNPQLQAPRALPAAAITMMMVLRRRRRIVEVGNKRRSHRRRGPRRRGDGGVPEPGPVPPVDIHVAPEGLRRPELPLAEAAGIGPRRRTTDEAAAGHEAPPWLLLFPLHVWLRDGCDRSMEELKADRAR